MSGDVGTIDHGPQVIGGHEDYLTALAAHSQPQVDDLVLGRCVLDDPNSPVLHPWVVERSQRHRRNVGFTNERTFEIAISIETDLCQWS
ncbi:hypothetical protein [Nitratireductor soli]|uniref:hypothetical protein n=1 Tax=Nitratireductor soli TaxID=1670619 RepID=UPI003139AC6D